MRPALLAFWTSVSLAATPVPTSPGVRVGPVQIIGRYELIHPERLQGLFSFDGSVVYGLDSHGRRMAWNLATSLPESPFAKGACAVQSPVAQLPSRDAVAGIGPTGRLLLCSADGKRQDDGPSPPLSDARLTALAARRESDGRVRYVWGDADGVLSQWRTGDNGPVRSPKADGAILSVAALPGGETLALSADGRLVHWSGKGAPLRAGARLSSPSCGLEAEPCPKGEVRISAAALDPDGGWALVSSATPGFQSYGVGEAKTELFDLSKEAKPRWTLRDTLASTATALGPRQLLVAVSTNRPPDTEGPTRVELLDKDTGKASQATTPPSPAVSVQFSPDGKTLAAGFADGALGLWEAESGKPIAHEQLKAGPLVSLAFSPDGKTLAVQPQEGPAQLADARTAKVQRVLKTLATQAERSSGPACQNAAAVVVSDDGEAGARELAFSQDGSELFATYAEGRCMTSDPCQSCPEVYTPARVRVADGGLLERWENADQPLFAHCSVALGVPVTPSQEGGAAAWDAHGRPVGRLGAPGVPVSRCATGGKLVALTAKDALYLQSRLGGTARRLPLPGKLSTVSLSPDGAYALVASESEVRLLSLPEGHRLEVLPLAASHDIPRALAFSPDGTRFVVGTQRGVLLEFSLSAKAKGPY